MSLGALREALARALEQNDWEAARQVRLQVASAQADSDDAAEALYRLGLDALFRARDLAQAVAYFEQASKKKHAYWSAAARVSMALCYAQQKRLQKAFFELRKVAWVKVPNVHSVAALTWMEQLHLAEKQLDEAHKARSQRVAQLKQLLAPAPAASAAPTLSPRERAEYLYQLACAQLDSQEAPARAEAQEALRQAQVLGPEALTGDLQRAVAELRKAAGG